MIVVIFIISLIFSLILIVGIDLIISKHYKLKPEDLNATERLVDISLDISEQISYYMYKYQITPKEFCKRLNINNDTLLIWLTGIYDFKLSQLTRIEAMFNEHLIKTTLINRKKLKITDHI